ncbi:MAG: type II secretion system F family protein [Acidobacteria bacterium]|nr:MAG: type II secretion system F family protein [Acidobacteriota bacterium]
MVVLLTLLVFVAAFGLALSAAYFLVVAPGQRKRMRVRLQSIQEMSLSPSMSLEANLLAEQLIDELPGFQRTLATLPLFTHLRRYTAQAAVDMQVTTVMLISLGLAVGGLLVTLLVGLPAALSLMAAVAAGAIPALVVAYKRDRRFSKFEELFPDSLDLLSRAVRAGHAFTTGLQLIANEMPNPVAEEFRQTYDQQNLGLPLRDALHNLAVRMPTSDVRIFVTALQIQRESGGNLAEVLDNLSCVIRERFKLYRQVKIYTAEGRLSLYVLTALPLVALILFYLTNPEYMSPLFVDPLGKKMLAGGAIMQVIGYLIIKRITRVAV